MEGLVLFSIFLPLEDYLQRIKSLESFRTIHTVHVSFKKRQETIVIKTVTINVQLELREYCMTLLVSQIRQFLKLHTSL